MWATLLHTLPYALVNAASPTIPVAAVALMALPGRGRRAIAWYAVGCTVVVVVVTALMLTAFSQVHLPKHIGKVLPAWADAVIGVVAIGYGLWLRRRGPRPEGAGGRSWDGLGPIAIVGVGAYMELINLFTPPAYLAGVMVATQQQLPTAQVVVVVTICALVVLAPVWGLLVLSLCLPGRTDAVITRIQGVFHRHGHTLLVWTLLGVGAFLLLRFGWSLLA